MATTNPNVQATDFLRQTLADAGMDADALIEEFRLWKAEGAEAEFTNYYFGKDAAYAEPRRNGRSVLRHVHMPPASDADALDKWERAWHFNSRKTSDAALIYAYDPAYGYLLLYYAIEPTAHSLSDMNDPESKELMHLFADIAERFIFDGLIIV